MNNSFILLSSLLVVLSTFLMAVKYISGLELKLTMHQKITSWWFIIVCILLAGQFEFGLSGLISAVIAACLYELAKITNQPKTNRLPVIVAFVFILQLALYTSQWFLAALSFSLTSYLLYSMPSKNQQGKDRAVFIPASLLCILGLSIASLILVLTSATPQEGTIGNLLFLVFISQGNDVAQYCWGKSIGGRKIAPSISPNKTWAGFLGGLMTFTLVGYYLGGQLTNMAPVQSAIAASIICTLGFLGDLLVSYLKRHYKVKDTGKLIPGHGGMGDRVDSLLLSTGGFFTYLMLIS